MSREIEVRVLFGACIEIKVYLYHIGCQYDSIPEVSIYFAFCLAYEIIVSSTFAEIATMSGSRCRRN